MDIGQSDAALSQHLLSFLLAQTVEELSDWVKAQDELGAAGLPVDDAAWGNVSFGFSAQSGLQKTEIVAPRRISEPVPAVSGAVPSARQVAEPVHKTAAAPGGTSKSMASFAALRSVKRNDEILTLEERTAGVALLKARIEACRSCPLGNVRRGVVCGMGPVDASIMFVGAGGNPAELDAGRIMTGDSAVLFDNIIAAMANLHSEAARERIYMTNVIKCACIPAKAQKMDVLKKCQVFLREEVRCIRPKVIIVWGETAYRAMFGGDELISQVRGKWLKFEGIPAIATHHPFEMVKNANLKGRVWKDLQSALAMI